MLMTRIIAGLLVFSWGLYPYGAHADDDLDDFPYELSSKVEWPLAALGVGLVGLSFALEENLHAPSENDLNRLDKNDINSFDRSAVENWSKQAADWSDVGFVATTLLPPALHISTMLKERWNQAWILGVMYLETLAINIGLTNAAKALVQRKRPFLYNQSISLDERLEAGTEGLKSFFSGHASMTFCSAVFLSTVVDDIYPESKWRYAVWSASLTLAAATAYLRYAAGVHYPTDLLTGALVGSIVGFTIPKLHKKKGPGDLSVAVLPDFDGSFFGMSLLVWTD